MDTFNSNLYIDQLDSIFDILKEEYTAYKIV